MAFLAKALIPHKSHASLSLLEGVEIYNCTKQRQRQERKYVSWSVPDLWSVATVTSVGGKKKEKKNEDRSRAAGEAAAVQSLGPW